MKIYVPIIYLKILKKISSKLGKNNKDFLLIVKSFDEIYLDSDSKEIQKYSIRKGYKFINRLPRLAKDNANGNDLLL